ncbi:MAG: tetratricopeptide repeat protein [bacterium]
MPELEIEALLESTKLWLDMKKYKEAIQDANQVLKLCARTGFKLYEPEAELALAKLHLAQGNPEQAEPLAQSAYEKAKNMHYRIIETEADNFLREIV